MKKNNASLFRLYENVKKGTLIYQMSDGTFLPDEQQPNPINDSMYSPHISTRYKNVVIGSNGLPKSYNLTTNELVETNKFLPELYNIRENCCGCTACYAICPVRKFLPNNGEGSIGKFGEIYSLPHGAIYMESDEEGFLYPVVDASLCIRCYKCLSVCPIKEHDKKRLFE